MVLHKPVVQQFLSPQYAVHWPVARLFWREPVDKTVIKHSSNKEEVELSVVCSMTSTDRRVDLVLSETFFWHVFVFRHGWHQLGTEIIWLYPSFALLLIKNHIKVTQRNQIRHCHKSEKGSSYLKKVQGLDNIKIAEQFVFCLVEVSLRQPHGQRRQVKMQASKKWRESQLLTFPSSIVFLLFPITGYVELDRRQLCLELLYLNIFLSSRHHVSS